MEHGETPMSEIVNVVSRTNGKVSRKKVRASPYEFTIATRAKWEMVIADEDVTIGAGKLERGGQEHMARGHFHRNIS